ncbi:MAG: hypothetical protein ACYTED_20340 [Planctomycetota bacterium]
MRILGVCLALSSLTPWAVVVRAAAFGQSPATIVVSRAVIETAGLLAASVGIWRFRRWGVILAVLTLLAVGGMTLASWLLRGELPAISVHGALSVGLLEVVLALALLAAVRPLWPLLR